MKVVNAYTYDNKISGEKPTTKPSRTIPNQTLGMRELIERHTRGQEVPAFEPIYYGPQDQFNQSGWERLSKMDAATKALEIKQLVEDERQNLQNLRESAFEKMRKIKKQQEKEKQAEIDRLDEIFKNQPPAPKPTATKTKSE